MYKDQNEFELSSPLKFNICIYLFIYLFQRYFFHFKKAPCTMNNACCCVHMHIHWAINYYYLSDTTSMAPQCFCNLETSFLLYLSEFKPYGNGYHDASHAHFMNPRTSKLKQIKYQWGSSNPPPSAWFPQWLHIKDQALAYKHLLVSYLLFLTTIKF